MEENRNDDGETPATPAPRLPGIPSVPPTAANIEAYLVAELERLLELGDEGVDLTRPLTRYALDSVEFGRLLGVLQRWTGQAIDPDALWDYPTIPEIAGLLGRDEPAP